MLPVSPRGPDHGRTCLGCRRQRPRFELIRIVRSPDGEACFDPEGRLPGRGAWFCPSPACLEAVTPAALSRVLRSPVRLPDAATRRRTLSEALARRVANLLSIARKTGGVTFGPTGVRAALSAGRAHLVLLAGDLSGDAAAVWAGRAAAVAQRTLPDAGALGELCGRGPATVAAITVAGLAEALAPAIDRWQAFSTISCDNEKLIVDSRAPAAPSGAAAGGG